MKKEAIKKEWHVPEKYHAQVREKPETFYNVPHEYRSPQLCLEAVRGWGYNLGIVPEEMKTREMCREAFNASPDLDYGHCAIIGFMPFADVVLECLKDSAGGTDMTDLAATVRPEVMDREIAGFLVGKDGHCLQYVPVHLQTEELALMAVRTSGNAVLLHRAYVRTSKRKRSIWQVWKKAVSSRSCISRRTDARRKYASWRKSCIRTWYVQDRTPYRRRSGTDATYIRWGICWKRPAVRDSMQVR